MRTTRRAMLRLLTVILAVSMVLPTSFMYGGSISFAETGDREAIAEQNTVDDDAAQGSAPDDAVVNAGGADTGTGNDAQVSADTDMSAPDIGGKSEAVSGEDSGKSGSGEQGSAAKETENASEHGASSGETGASAGAEDKGAAASSESSASGDTGTSDSGEEQEGLSFSTDKDESVYAVIVQGKAAGNKKAAKSALRNNTGLTDKEIDDIADALFAAKAGEADAAKSGAGAAKADPDYPSSGDGSKVESITAKWITTDSVDNGDDALLYVRPGNDNAQEVRLQINYALSGEHNYDPGDITITVPASMFKDRSGRSLGEIIIPFPEDPIRTDDFNWKLIGDNYVLTNTKKMSAATKGYIQFAFTGLTPHLIQDMQVSDEFSAYIQVLTHKDNTIASRSNPLTAQFDTEARLNGVSKKVYGAPKVVKASAIPESQRIEGVDEYIKVDWYVWGNTSSNTMYTIDQVDTIPDEYNGFIIGATSEDGRTLERKGMYSGYSNGQGASYSFSTAYPAAQFEPDTDYVFHNNISYTLTEKDPDAEKGNPNVNGGIDERLVTTGSASATAVYSYRDPEWIDPTGHYMIVKNGNDGIQSGNRTHQRSYGTGSYSDLHIWSKGNPIHGWYGIYPSAINKLQDEYSDNGAEGGIALSYTINSVGYVMPWMYDSSSAAV
ncbi:MAG: hypothetical protein IIY88_03535, partial [Eubacterium sp.]|nr:hypothetical protein [Eubacterium sp.]